MQGAQAPPARPPLKAFGHSAHGAAYDSGLRGKPWKIEGTGSVHFPITTKAPEAQVWFDQGIALLHSFWYEEAERSFRWCLKLDPDCAMAYWGLAQCREDLKGIEDALRLKEKVSERERLFIEAWEPVGNGQQGNARGRRGETDPLIVGLQRFLAKYPDELEAKAQFAWAIQGKDSPYATQAVIDQILAKDPTHPGALHTSIHNWDYSDPAQALESCRRYSLAAPGIGHAMHMPGHIYSKIGMWHEAARSMDAATRIELRYMNERLAMPQDVWNFPHNRDYLCYIQEQLGMISASVQGARDLLAAPASRTPAEGVAAQSSVIRFGLPGLLRAYMKADCWDEIVKPNNIPWPDSKSGFDRRDYYEALAYAHLNRAKEARASFERYAESLKPKGAEDKTSKPNQMRLHEAEGWVRLAEGDRLGGMRFLLDAAVDEDESRTDGPPAGDPPIDAGPIMRQVGDLYLKRGDTELAIDAYDKSLKYLPNDGFSLAGLAQAWAKRGDRERAKEYAGRLEYVWSKADSDLKPLVAVRALGLDAKPVAKTPAPERPYRPEELASYGPSNWQPFPAPALHCQNVDGKTVDLKEFRGKNVVLVFYLSDECVHCVEQLQGLSALADDFTKSNTIVLAVSGATPAANKASLKVGKLGVRLLSDAKDHDNARRFASYDDFEDMELHSTILIDAQGRVRWMRTGGDPFKDVGFLLKEIGRFGGK